MRFLRQSAPQIFIGNKRREIRCALTTGVWTDNNLPSLGRSRDVAMLVNKRSRSVELCFKGDSEVILPCMVMIYSGLITVGRELRQQHPSDLLSGGDVPRADNKSLGCCCRNSLPTVINPLNKKQMYGSDAGPTM